MVVQTAASVNGFADDQSVLLVDGVKRTTPTRWPDRLVIDTDVSRDAPAELNRAGLGDLLATYTAPADWLLARLVGQDDSYSPAAVDLLAAAPATTSSHGAGGIDRGDPDAIESLCAALTLSGISMGVAGHTAPGSGMEHAVSHLLEMAERPDERHAAARRQGRRAVGARRAALGTGARRAREPGGLHALRFPTADEMEPRVRAAFADVDPSRPDRRGVLAATTRASSRAGTTRAPDARDAARALAGVRRRARGRCSARRS